MKTALCILLTAASAIAGPRTSANYSIVTDTADAAGLRATSASYTNDASASAVAGTSTLAPAGLTKAGYIAQLYEVTALELTAPALALDEGATLQLAARLLLDDTTLLALASSAVMWTVQSGPLVSIGADGLATAGVVFENTDSVAQGGHLGFTGTLTLSVLNTTTDDFGNYAGDGIADEWQVQHFGEDNPFAAPGLDPDGDGQTNLFEYTAGLVPTDPASIFRLRIEVIPGQPGWMNVIFSPRLPDRIYTVESRPGLDIETWEPLTMTLESDDGPERTVTDLDASSANRLYRVEISKP